MAYFHGARSVSEGATVSTPVVAESGITAVIGACPAYMSKDGIKKMAFAQTFEEAKAQMGYSDDWAKYPACEAMYVFFKVYGVSPLVIINTLKTTESKKDEESKEVTEGKLVLPATTARTSIKLSTAETGDPVYVEGVDYDLEYTPEALIVTFYDDEISTVKAEYTELTVTEQTEDDITGGVDEAGEASGAECIDYIFPKFGIIPDIVIAPGFSEKAEVAAVLAAKIKNINTIFHGGTAFCDIDCEKAKKYTDVLTQKGTQGLAGENMYALWPMIKQGEKIFHLSTVAAALTCSHDEEMGTPCESPSNLALNMTGACLKDGTDIVLTLAQANYLNENGVATALNFMGTLNLWGNETACYPTETDPSAYFLNMRRMRGWIENTLIKTHWARVDRNQTRRLIDNVVDATNIWLNGLVSAGAMLSASVEATADDNPTTDVIAGTTKYRVKLGLCSPNREMVFITEYDADAVAAALAFE